MGRVADTLIVRAAPQEYICGPGSWNGLEQHLERRGISSALVVRGGRSWEAAKGYFPEFKRVEIQFYGYGGECTYAERDRIASEVTRLGLQSIIAVGGGKVSDSAKAAAALLRIPVVILPTLAATCSAWSSLSVMYDKAGTMVGFEVYPHSNSLVLLEPRVILDSPPELLVAGIGDTLAKWYEADAIIAHLPSPSEEIALAHYAARRCRDNLMAHSAEALAAQEAGELNDAFVRVVETNIMTAGLVGGFGEDYGRTAGAHSIHDALTILPETHRLLHGSKVAYGVLVQLVLEGKQEEVVRLLPFYEKIGLPAALKDMGLDGLSREVRLRVAARAAEPGASIHRMPGTFDAVTVAGAMEDLESLVAAIRVRETVAASR
ncbi:iron-containing alcohol dehydrogenase family protein [Paenibacillus sp. 7124]|uniref:Iron-containing alcohol dehydrogenase family protein n=1 Tax=Paenibacillus apii TaxID=1850370 RepID=A0A6M1PGL9_9BACL|nr:iron-containing alcohol dehydrogenase family protein [Paenibacillus apii]